MNLIIQMNPKQNRKVTSLETKFSNVQVKYVTLQKDEILYKNIIAQMVDRRMLSYKTALEEVGFDYENELGNMENELQMVLDGVFGSDTQVVEDTEAACPVRQCMVSRGPHQ